MKKERKEALIRIPIATLFVIIAELWGTLMIVILILHLLITLITGKRNRNLAEFSNIYVNYVYSNARYIFFATNERPWPFTKLEQIHKVDFKFQN